VSAYIPDASVAAKWFLPHDEPLAEESLRILEGYSQGEIQLSVPDLFWHELGSILWKAVRLGPVSEESAEEAIGYLSGLSIPTSPSQPLLADAFPIAVNFQRGVCHAAYVALAVISNRSPVTADDRLAQAMATNFPVRWLGSVGYAQTD
jgi:predicted nucleic acid-binding protein